MNYIKEIKHTNKRPLEKVKLEIELQTYISNKYDFCPKIKSYKHYKDKTEIIMEHLNGYCLADIYGDEGKTLPNEIREIINILFYEEGIEYIDITPYNFIKKNNKVYIIDFGDAYWNENNGIIRNWFLKEFLEENVNDYNVDFR